jgi:hypothetical protein
MNQPSAKWVALAAGVEVVTGLVLVIRPSVFGVLVFGAAFSPPGQALGRLAGFALLGLAWACWPRQGTAEASRSALTALFGFSVLTAVYLVYLGIFKHLAGPLLWPATVLHLVIAILLARASLAGSQSGQQ